MYDELTAYADSLEIDATDPMKGVESNWWCCPPLLMATCCGGWGTYSATESLRLSAMNPARAEATLGEMVDSRERYLRAERSVAAVG